MSKLIDELPAEVKNAMREEFKQEEDKAAKHSLAAEIKKNLETENAQRRQRSQQANGYINTPAWNF